VSSATLHRALQPKWALRPIEVSPAALLFTCALDTFKHSSSPARRKPKEHLTMPLCVQEGHPPGPASISPSARCPLLGSPSTEPSFARPRHRAMARIAAAADNCTTMGGTAARQANLEHDPCPFCQKSYVPPDASRNNPRHARHFQLRGQLQQRRGGPVCCSDVTGRFTCMTALPYLVFHASKNRRLFRGFISSSCCAGALSMGGTADGAGSSMH
jgi:hypothetical protein